VEKDEVVISANHHRFFAGGSPLLRSVRLRGLCLQHAPVLTNLKSLTLTTNNRPAIKHDWTRLRDIFRQSPELTELALIGTHILLPPHTEIPVISSYSLRSLALSFRHNGEPDLLRFFTHLDIPQLESLQLNSMFRWDLDFLVDIWLRNRTPRFLQLHTLELNCCGEIHNDENDSLSHFFDFFPTVKALRLIRTDGKFMLETRWLGERERDKTREELGVPRLVSSVKHPPWVGLDIITLDPSSIEQVALLIKIVQSRIASGHPLGHVRIPRRWLNEFRAEAEMLCDLVSDVEWFSKDAG